MGALYTEVYEEDPRACLRNPEASFALSCWELARTGAEPPFEADLLKQKIAWLRPDLMILRRNLKKELVYEAYGENIVAWAGFDMTGKKVNDFKGLLGDFYGKCYARVIATGRPMATVHRLGNYNERPIWERVILPVRDGHSGIALYVVNRVRKLQDDFALISSRARGNGVIALQFTRNLEGGITDALIAGANAPACAMTGRRLDELLDRSIRECFPGIIDHALWERYLQVAETREELSFQIDYRQDGMNDLFDVKLYPFRDGVAIDFRVLRRAAADANAQADVASSIKAGIAA